MPDLLETAAREALTPLAPSGSVGDVVSVDSSDEVTTFRFASRVDGYAGWVWAVSLATIDGGVTVLETELVAGEGSLLSPDWVPWSERLKEYRASLVAGEAAEVDVDAAQEALDAVLETHLDVTLGDDDDDSDDDDESDDSEDDDEDDSEDDDEDSDDDDLEDDDDEDLTDQVESRYDDTDVFDGVDEAGSEDDEFGDEYRVIDDEPRD
ncbi:MAG: hypothetical protein RIS25_684 [Actinomycetota bacterium]